MSSFPFDVVIFDLDGTLIDSAPDIHAALNHVLEDTGLPGVGLSLTRDFVGMGSKALIKRALDHHQKLDHSVSHCDPEAMLIAFLEFYENNLAVHSAPFPTTVETLTTMAARGAKLAVVTNKYVGLSESVLEQLDLRKFFACVVGSETTPNPKPAADPALHACKELGVIPANALFIGDASPDVGCARAAGCRRWGRGSVGNGAPPAPRRPRAGGDARPAPAPASGHRGAPRQRLPADISDAMWSACRIASATMVSVGFSAAPVVN